ncbi:MAG: NAD(P)H-dependent oxidoreductase [Pseudomonadota bacterium]
MIFQRPHWWLQSSRWPLFFSSLGTVTCCAKAQAPPSKNKSKPGILSQTLAFAASSSRQSNNRQLVNAAANLFKSEFEPNAEIQFLDLNDYEMPIYSIDPQIEAGNPELVHQLFNKNGGAGALIISDAQHSGFHTAA